jgi:hypothetical protein
MDLGEIGWGGIEWVNLAQDRKQWKAPVKDVMNLSSSIKYWEVVEWLQNWRCLE